MKKDNPFESPKSSSVGEPNAKILLWSAVTIAGSAVFGALLGGGIGFSLGTLFPNYYRGIFERPQGPDIDPIAMGVGQGVTQGFVGGIVFGFVLVALFYWYTLRMAALARQQT